ncbi:MAG: hypothetical protein U0R50_02695 [Gaiellales bacterium]
MRSTFRFDRSRAALAAVVGITLILVATAVGAVVPRSAVSGGTKAAASALSLARPAGVQSGDLLLAAVSHRSSSAVSVSAPSGWTLVRSDSCAGPGGVVQTQNVYTRLASGSEPGSYGWSFSGAGGAVGAVVAYSGVDAASPVAVSGGGYIRNSAYVKALSVNSPIANGMVVAVLGHSDASAIPTPSGMTARAAASTGGGPAAALTVADVTQAVAGATGNKSAKASAIAACDLGQLVVLRPGSGTVTPPPAAVKPANTVLPAISGTAQVGSTLSLTDGTWTGTAPITYAYQWQRCGTSCAAIAGATAKTYAAVAADQGQTLRAVVTASNAAGSTAATSAATAAVQPAPPVVVAPAATAAPVVSGTAKVGDALAATTGTWSGSTPMAYARQWQRCNASGSACATLAGVTGASYTPAASDTGMTLRVAVTASNAGGAATSTSAPSAVVTVPSTGGKNVIVNNGSWTCSGPVDLDLVKVTSPSGDAIVLGDGCTGRIGRIEVDTWTQDGVKIQNQDSPAHDLVVEGGYVTCHDITPGAHQDAVQAMGGARITFRNITFDCLGNSNFFVNQAGAGTTTPTDIVCDGCNFGGKSSTTVRVNNAVRSGIRNSAGCTGRNVDQPFFFTDAAVSPVNTGNRELPASDPLCS